MIKQIYVDYIAGNDSNASMVKTLKRAAEIAKDNCEITLIGKEHIIDCTINFGSNVIIKSFFQKILFANYI